MKNKNYEPQATGYLPVIGLEVHVELKTKSKMFCGCSAEHFAVKPNTHTCPVCLGLPGALPVPNRKAIEWCVMIGLALNCDIPLFSKFDRKNYFYPDLPKGYQISQYDKPFAINGSILLSNKKTIRIRRVHMEEDTAKLVHEFGTQNSNVKTQSYSLIDFNRSGVPLVEIVTEPDFESADEVVGYLKKLQQIVRYLGVSDADMEKGMMRLEPNVSLWKRNTTNTTNKQISNIQLPDYKVEVKNINSFRFVDKAITYELKRQEEVLKAGQTPTQETRGWDEKKVITVSQRSKEEAHDYRYFPEPDIPPVRWNESQILNLKSQMPELPDAKLERFKKDFQLNDYDAEILTRDRSVTDFFEECVKVGHEHNITPKQIANAIINKKIDIGSTLPVQLIEQIVSSKKVSAISGDQLENIVQQTIKEHPKAIEDFKNGKQNAIMFMVGMVVRKIPEKVDVSLIKSKIEAKLKE